MAKRKAKLLAIDAEPLGASIIDRLDEVRAAAEAGKVSSIAIAVVYRDGNVSHCTSDMPSLSVLLGAIERMKFAILQAYE